jgi:hypothetical protein
VGLLVVAAEQPWHGSSGNAVPRDLQAVDPPAITALVVGPRRELIKLTGAHLTLSRILPDTITGRAVTLDLLPSDVEVPRGGEVRVQDIQPRQVTLQLDPVVFRSVPVHPDLRLELDSGTRLVRAVQVFPGVVRLTGPADQVARIDSVKTMPIRVEKVEESSNARLRLIRKGSAP